MEVYHFVNRLTGYDIRELETGMESFILPMEKICGKC